MKALETAEVSFSIFIVGSAYESLINNAYPDISNQTLFSHICFAKD